jgi:NADPH-ferrihemoprotein reductase
LSYFTADNLSILPVNPPDLVARALKILRISNPDTLFVVSSMKANKKVTIPGPLTIREALERYCDLRSPPSRRFVGTLAQFTRSDDQKAKLLQLVARDDQSKAFFNLVFNVHRVNIVDLLEKYSHIDLPFDVFIELCPRLQPRAYTISSSKRIHPTSVHVTLTVVSDKIPDIAIDLNEDLMELKSKVLGMPEAELSRSWPGLCSNYLASLIPGDKVLAFVKPSTFRLPVNPTVPVIMVGPGSGIAPMRAFLQEATFLSTQGSPPVDWALFFGCRYRDVDYLYKEELEMALSDGTLKHLIVAFSRETHEKVYVQHKLAEQASLVFELINKGAYIYLCGSTAMGRDVREAIKAIIQANLKCSEQEAIDKFKELQSKKRYVQELW